MSTIHCSRSLVFGIATVFALTLFAPVAVTAHEEKVAVLAPVAAPAVVTTSGQDARASRAIAAERALQSSEMGSMQEEHLRAFVDAAPSWDEISGYGAVEASRAINALPAAPSASASAAQTRVLAAQRALQGGDLGSLQEGALRAVVSAASTTQVPSDVR
jgi:hypothetical protein